jgi:hypothetical protein
MIDYSKVKVGDKFKIVGAGAPGFAKLGDVVTAESVGHNRVDVRHDTTGETVYFALTCGAARLEPYDALAALRPVETISELEPVK